MAPQNELLEKKQLKETLPTPKPLGTARISILLCTYNGAMHLDEQLDSITNQSVKTWKIQVSDDGSSDQTIQLLSSYSERFPDAISIVNGPGQGFARNFLSLIANASGSADYYAYADQDDIWEEDKLERAIIWLSTVELGKPALYMSRTRYVAENGARLGLSTLFSKPPEFRNALVQSLGGGNTMVFNAAAMSLLKKTVSVENVVSHDWWTYLVVSGCGGKVHYDRYPGVRYRQHSNNAAGQNTTLGARIVRVKKLFSGDFKRWNDINIDGLMTIRNDLSHQNRAIFDKFRSARDASFAFRLVGLLLAGVYRQPTLGNLGLFIAALWKKI